MLAQVPQQPDEEFSIEYRRSVFRWAADQVRPKVKPSTWKAFWRTSVDDEPVDVVAAELGMSVGTVYVARSRVMARLQDTATRFEDPS